MRMILIRAAKLRPGAWVQKLGEYETYPWDSPLGRSAASPGGGPGGGVAGSTNPT